MRPPNPRKPAAVAPGPSNTRVAIKLPQKRKFRERTDINQRVNVAPRFAKRCNVQHAKIPAKPDPNECPDIAPPNSLCDESGEDRSTIKPRIDRSGPLQY
jgi:hypothetical protein